MKTVINQMREDKQNKNKTIYYIDLRSQFEQFKLQSISDLQKLTLGMMERYNQFVSENQNNFLQKDQILVVDDINQLDLNNQSNGNVNYRDVFMHLVALGHRMKVILISSSSQYCSALQNLGFIKKQSEFRIIRPKDQQNLAKAMASIIKTKCKYPFLDEKKQKEMLTFFTTRQYSLRRMRYNLESIIKSLGQNQQSHQNIMQKLTKLYQQDKNQLKDYIKLLLGDSVFSEGDQVNKTLLKGILKLKTTDEINFKDCRKVLNQFNEQTSNLQTYAKLVKAGKIILDQLDRKNLLIYCHPRSKWIHQIFQEIVNQE